MTGVGLGISGASEVCRFQNGRERRQLSDNKPEDAYGAMSNSEASVDGWLAGIFGRTIANERNKDAFFSTKPRYQETTCRINMDSP